MNPEEIKDLISSEGREVAAQGTGPAPVSSCSPLAFRIQLFLQRKHRRFHKVPCDHFEHIQVKLDQRSSWERR